MELSRKASHRSDEDFKQLSHAKGDFNQARKSPAMPTGANVSGKMAVKVGRLPVRSRLIRKRRRVAFRLLAA
jgi:hypothetical protein